MSKRAAKTSDYGRGAALLSAGIGATGLVTFAFFFLGSHNLSPDAWGQVGLLWTVVFATVSVMYRPIEQLLARTIAEREARGESFVQPLKVSATIQAGLAVAVAAVSLSLRGTIERELFDGREALFWIMFGSVLAYAASYFARGVLAGTKRFALYAGLVFVESISRVMFPLAVAVGVAGGQTAVALGVLAAPLLSLLVVPLALLNRSRAGVRQSPGDTFDAVEEEAALDAASSGAAREEAEFTLAEGGGFAAAAVAIMFAEQVFINAGPLLVKVSTGGSAALSAYVFNLLVIARAPMQLFQSISTSLLPHLSGLRVAGDMREYRRSVNMTLLAIAGFAAFVTVLMLAAAPPLLGLAFGDKYTYDRTGPMLIAVGMGVYLCAATVNQAALAAKKTAAAAACWIASAGAFVVWMLLPVEDDLVNRVEYGYLGGATLLFASLYALYRATTPSR